MSKERPHPVGGKDYPQTLQEFDEWFDSEDACLRFLQKLRWPDGFICPRCGESSSWTTARGLLRCPKCDRQTSITAGTIFEGTRKPLRIWFLTAWFVTNQKLGGSALGLQRLLGLGSYQTAWAWLHKLRRAMVRPGRERLKGTVEIDEVYVGTDEGVRGREAGDKAIVVVAVEEIGSGMGRVRLRQIPDVSSKSLLPFIDDSVAAGSTIHTDGWSGYDSVAKLDYQHKVTVLRRTTKKAHELLPRVHRVAALLKRWLLGTHQGAASKDHLDYYLDEFTFRFNRRHSKARGLLFYRLLEQAVVAAPAPYRALVGGKTKTNLSGDVGQRSGEADLGERNG